MNELKYFAWLSHIYDVHAKNMDYLLEVLGSPYDIFRARPGVIESQKRLAPQLKERLLALKRKTDPDEIWEYMAEKGIGFISKFDEAYPPLLQTIENPPFGLFYMGNIPSFDLLWIAVIGTRKPTAYGKDSAGKLAKELAANNTVIVSGLAEGLDGRAHLGAIEANGLTVAVLGNGVDICYPSFNRHIYDKVIENGALISEFPPKIMPKPWHFPKRNRIISGLCQGLAVIEAGMPSGTLITVDCALEQGREVFAVPGNISSPKSAGTNMLIKDGAGVLICADDILDVFHGSLRYDWNNFNEELNNIESIPLAPDEKTVYALLGSEPLEFEEILLDSGLSYQSVTFALTNLELNGRIKQLPGQRYTL